MERGSHLSLRQKLLPELRGLVGIAYDLQTGSLWMIGSNAVMTIRGPWKLCYRFHEQPRRLLPLGKDRAILVSSAWFLLDMVHAGCEVQRRLDPDGFIGAFGDCVVHRRLDASGFPDASDVEHLVANRAQTLVYIATRQEILVASLDASTGAMSDVRVLVALGQRRRTRNDVWLRPIVLSLDEKTLFYANQTEVYGLDIESLTSRMVYTAATSNRQTVHSLLLDCIGSLFITPQYILFHSDGRRVHPSIYSRIPSDLRSITFGPDHSLFVYSHRSHLRLQKARYKKRLVGPALDAHLAAKRMRTVDSHEPSRLVCGAMAVWLRRYARRERIPYITLERVMSAIKSAQFAGAATRRLLDTQSARCLESKAREGRDSSEGT